MNTRSSCLAAPPLLLAALTLLGPAPAAGDGAGEAPLVQALAGVKRSLLQAVRAAATAPSVAISAQFEDDGQGLRLSVCTAGLGLEVEAEANVLQRLRADPRAHAWQPSTEVLRDAPDVARASAQLTLLRTTKLSLIEALLAAEAALRPFQDATLFSIAPAVQDGKGVFLVGTAVAGAAYRVVLDLQSGAGLAPWPTMPRRLLPTPLVGKVLPEPVTGPGGWIGSAPSSLAETVARKVVLVVSTSYG